MNRHLFGGLLLSLVPLSASSASAKLPIVFAPKAAPVNGQIEQITLGPIAAEQYSCVEYPLGQLAYAGDALGTDCSIIGGGTDGGGYPQLYRMDGKTNSDWFGWHTTLLAPIDGVIVGAYEKDEVNVPGVFGKPPAAMVQIRTAAGIIVTMAHVTDLLVKVGDRVTADQPVGKVGNNGFARAPHTHFGAWRERYDSPLQIGWDLRAIAKVQLHRAG